jgi:(hydroxyamino)benzene mutase
MISPARRLCWHGIMLFLLGLFTGVLIPAFTNPRMGLSAHLAAVQSGMFVVLVGLLWPQLRLSARAAAATVPLLLVATYGTWVALVMAATFGTSRSTPIAGAGFTGSGVAELSVTLLIGTASLAALVGTVLVLRGLGGGEVGSGPEGR